MSELRTLEIKTENIAIPLSAASFSKDTDIGVTIQVTTPCMGQARKLASDFSLALEYGASPGLQARMIEAVQDAEKRNMPLSCILSFGS